MTDIDSDDDTFIRTVVILVTPGLIRSASAFHSPGEVTTRTWVFLVLSGLATGASWIC